MTPWRILYRFLGPLAAVAMAACAVGPVFPDDVQHAFNRDSMRRAETPNLIIYYPARRRAEVERFAARADACAGVLKSQARIHSRSWAEKMTITMPEVAFNNAYVSPKVAGSPDHSVIPTFSELDFTTEFGLPPDPGFIACHELVHYVQFQQISGLWDKLNYLGDLFSPQVGFDSWLFEGLATHYEASLQPGAGRPTWPLFTGMFAAAYAGTHVTGGDLSELGRRSPVGHHYLVGTMFVHFLIERYGEAAMWKSIGEQSSAWLGLLAARSLRLGFGRSLGTLLDEFDAWHTQRFPARARPPTQRALATVGNDARYARGRDGSEAWIADGLDLPTRLIVRGRDGRTRDEIALTSLLPPRKLVASAPLLASGLSLTADGEQVWFTAIDLGSIAQTTRLMRWRASDGLQEMASGLGPGATIDPAGKRYYFLEADGDRWSLAVYDLASASKRTLLEAAPGTYVLGAQLSPDGTQLAASAWNGAAFTIWILDAATGALISELRDQGPLYDPAFLDDGRLVYLAAVEGRFQVQMRQDASSPATTLTDVPYTALAPRGSGTAVRFLNREGWDWTLDEVPVPAAAAPAPAPTAPTPTLPAAEPATSTAMASATPSTTATPSPSPTPSPNPTPNLNPSPNPSPSPSPNPTPNLNPNPSPSPTPNPSSNPTPTPSPDPVVALDTSAAAATTPVALASPLSADHPYSAWEGFFFPSLRAPLISQVVGGNAHLGLVLGGSDVLGMHRWLLIGLVQPKRDGDSGGPYYGGSVRYANRMLAPWTIAAEASAVHGAETYQPMDAPAGADPLLRDRKTRDLILVAGRSWRGTWLTRGGASYTEDRTQEQAAPLDRRRLGGPLLFVSYFAGEATPYTGLRRALEASLLGRYYPARLSSLERDATSVRAAVGLVAPLPFTRRHILTLRTVGRAILRPVDLIELGGTSAFAPIVFRSNRDEPTDPTFLTPPNLRLTETLRGYEDTTFAVSSLLTSELSWTYPLILDRGLASTLSVFPPSFLRQLDLELFAAGALTDNRAGTTAQHFAAGGALTLRIAILRIPLAFRYQVARRLRDDRAVTHLIGVGADL